MASNNKFLQEEREVSEILTRAPYELTEADTARLMAIYQVPLHGTSSKIEGVYSCDADCLSCGFCQKMREAAKKDNKIICGKCYATRNNSYRSNNAQRHALNARIMSAALYDVKDLATLAIGQLLRFNSDGEIDNSIEGLTIARNYLRIAYAHPSTRAAIWTKNVETLRQALKIEGKPRNLVIIQSSPRIDTPVKRDPIADYTFTVYSSSTINEAINNGCAECNEKKCMTCGYKCYYKAHQRGTDIAEKLR